MLKKILPADAGDTGDVDSIPGPGRSPGKGNGYPLQYSYLENPKDFYVEEEPGGLQSIGSQRVRTEHAPMQTSALIHTNITLGN